MDDLGQLLASIAAGFEGDADAAAEAFTGDAVMRESPGAEDLIGREEILTWFLAFGGRRERFELGEVLRDDDRAAISYAVRFRADAQAFGQHGMALLHLRDGLVYRWDGVWVEVEEDLAAWGGD